MARFYAIFSCSFPGHRYDFAYVLNAGLYGGIQYLPFLPSLRTTKIGVFYGSSIIRKICLESITGKSEHQNLRMADMENRVKYFIVSVSNVTGGLFFLQVDFFFSGWTPFSQGGRFFLCFFTLSGTQNLAVEPKTLLWNPKPYIGTQNLGVFYKKYRKSSSIKGKQISFRPLSSPFSIQ